jgi:hypothetical protein
MALKEQGFSQMLAAVQNSSGSGHDRESGQSDRLPLPGDLLLAGEKP